MKTRERERDSRDSILTLLLILLFGFICIIFASGWALRFAPSWRANSSMGSNLNPDSDFLTNMPVSLIEPLDPAILTNPPWFDVFLTPGATFATRIARDTATSPAGVTSTNTSVPVVTLSPTGTISITNTPVPTNTLIFIPPPNTSTPKPPPPPPDTAVPTNTNTSVPAVLVDLQVTKTDGVAAYTAGGLVTYSIVVTNPTGPGNVVGAIVSDSFPAQIASATWTCVAAGGASCTASGSGNINDTVNVPAGGSLTYTVTANISASATGNMTNTAAVAVPAGYTDTNSGNNSASDTDTPAFSANLGITKTDNVSVYMAGNALRYTIVVSNAGPSSVIGATVSDPLLSNPNLTNITWTCTGSSGATCTAAGAGDINDNAVNLPFGASVTYTVNATVVASPSGDLVNTASVSSSSIPDPNPGNNSATDTDILLSSVGTTPDGTVFVLSANGFLTLNLNTAANGDPGVPDLVYYEQPEGSGVLLDWVIVQVGDGTSWFTVFNWGDEARDTNTNMDYAGLTLPPPVGPPPNEPDQRDILSTDLFMSTGIAIDLDGVVPAGNYLYVRFLAPAGAGDVQIDAVQSLP